MSKVKMKMGSSVCREIIESLMERPRPSEKDLMRIKLETARKFSLKYIPGNSELIGELKAHERNRLLSLLKRKPSRSASGILTIAVMTKPWPCPKDKPCIYCPGGPKIGVPQSYTGREPAAMRGIQNDYDPYLQVKRRMKQLEAIGHDIDKVELIVMGGTFPSTPVEYQEGFIKGCLDALTCMHSKDLDESKRNAELSAIHNVGITVETRPDWSKSTHVDMMLGMGVTRVELGVQNIYDDIYEMVDRGHKVEDVIESTRILKDAGLKVGYHLMPGLPGSDFDRDLEAFRRIFSEPSFKPDTLKIYPCLVIKGTELYDLWRKGKYRPYGTDEAAELILQLKMLVPPWVRISRIQRDIPADLIVDGVKKSNLRQLVHERLRHEGLSCRCIRCREAGYRSLEEGTLPEPDKVQISTVEEEASEGRDIFLSVEDTENDILLGYLRLRIPSPHAHRQEIHTERTAVVRELRVSGLMLPVGGRPTMGVQHRGYGKALLQRAEEIAESRDIRKIVVMSALGTKRYYMELGYHSDGPYVSKRLGI